MSLSWPGDFKDIRYIWQSLQPLMLFVFFMLFQMNVHLTMVDVAINVLWFLEEELYAPALQDSVLIWTTKPVRLWITVPSTLSVVKYVNSIKIPSSAHVTKAGSSVRMEKIVSALVSWNSIYFQYSRCYYLLGPFSERLFPLFFVFFFLMRNIGLGYLSVWLIAIGRTH